MYFLAAAIAYALYIFLAGPPSGVAPVLTAPKKGELKSAPDHHMLDTHRALSGTRA